MKILYLDCGMGAAGDMLAGALLDLIEDKQAFLERLNQLDLPGVEVIAETKSKCGINGINFTVKVNQKIEGEDQVEHNHLDEHTHQQENHHNHEHSRHHAHVHTHRSMQEIEDIISRLDLKSEIKQNIINVYKLLAEAESEAHGVEVSEIHFHEVGTMDAITDIAAVCMLIDELSVDKILASPIHVGSGSVKCAHGILPVPAPATAYILRDVPIYGGEIEAELCTPTGAALLKYFVDDFIPMPLMKTVRVSYGHGKKNFAQLNSVRAFLGEIHDQAPREAAVLLQCNLDDMTPEAIAFATEIFFKQGALDVYTLACGMKKSRPGILLNVLCEQKRKLRMVNLIFKHTSTIGIREIDTKRYTLERSTELLETSFGLIRKKYSQGFGIQKSKFEYEDLAEIALANELSLAELEYLIKLKTNSVTDDRL